MATELLRRGRVSEANVVGGQSGLLSAHAQVVFKQLARGQPIRLIVHTPEYYVEASESEYERGEYSQCVDDASEALKLRPGVPRAWTSIALCNRELGEWDSAVAAAREALRIEPESDQLRENLDAAIAGRRMIFPKTN